MRVHSQGCLHGPEMGEPGASCLAPAVILVTARFGGVGAVIYHRLLIYVKDRGLRAWALQRILLGRVGRDARRGIAPTSRVAFVEGNDVNVPHRQS